MSKKLIINADDYGLNSDINQAIINLSQVGAITSTSVMANFASDDSIAQLKQTSISTGLHLNLIEGKPVSGALQVKTLTDDQGIFLSWHQLLLGFALGKIKKNEVEVEIENQFEVLRSNGLIISHADSHKHIHQFPSLGPFVLKTFKRLGIERVRNCTPSNWKYHRMSTLALFSLITKNKLRSFSTPQRLITHFSANRYGNISDLVSELSRAFYKFDTLEVMTHPGLNNRAGSYYDHLSEYEYLRYIFVKQKERLKNVELISYSEL
jgi:predicted glycoside hydrolase/deacetylase ChbG (UPF0249 family)